MKKVFSFLILFSCCTLLFGQHNLQYRLTKGDTFIIKQKAKQIITQEIDGAEHQITNLLDGTMEFVVKNESEDGYELTIAFKDLNLNMVSSIQGELLNVKAAIVDESDIQSKIFNSLLDEHVYMVMAKNGDVLQVTGGDSLVSKMANASGLLDDFSLNMMKKSLEKEFGSEALSDSYKQMTYIYPDKTVEIGESWENEYFGKLNAKNVWTFTDSTQTTAIISGQADVVMDITEPATTMKLNGTQQTNITADISNGFILKMEVEGNFEGISTMTQLGVTEIPTTISSTVSYELLEPLAAEPIKY